MNPADVSSKAVSRMLREFRKLKVGLILADQSPANISPDIVKLTGTKYVGRTVELSDRQIIGGAMLFNDTHFEQVARLRPGQAYFISEGYHGPRLIQMTTFHERLDLSSPLGWPEVTQCIADEPWFLESRARIEATWLLDLDAQVQRLDTKRHDILTRLKNLRDGKADDLMPQGGSPQTQAGQLFDELNTMLADARFALRDLLSRKMYSPDLEKKREALRRRFETNCEPDTQSCLDILKKIREQE